MGTKSETPAEDEATRRSDVQTQRAEVENTANPSRKDAGGEGTQADARTHAGAGPDEDGTAPGWESVLARAVAEDDFATIAHAWEMCYPGESGDAAVRDLTEWD